MTSVLLTDMSSASASSAATAGMTVEQIDSIVGSPLDERMNGKPNPPLTDGPDIPAAVIDLMYEQLVQLGCKNPLYKTLCDQAKRGLAQGGGELGICCYGGTKPKSACASCAAWKPAAALSRVAEPVSEPVSVAAALWELIKLKDIKEQMEAGTANAQQTDYYNSTKESAWQAARKAAELYLRERKA